jgi:hypothetical protein
MMNKILISLVLFALSAGTLLADNFNHQHTLWNEILKKYVDADRGVSRVDYQAIQRNQAALNQYLEKLESVSLEEYQGWSKPQRLAFLINAYNAFTVKFVVDNYPVDSIRDLGGWLSSPWKKKFFTLLGEKKHLDNIEHDIIRKDFHEPRIHFAVNCAAVGCPPLRQEAFVAERLDQQLEEATRVFLMDERKNRYDPLNKSLELSSIFKWYGDDFEKKEGSIETFVTPYITRDPQAQERIRRREVQVRYLDYDWSLNEQKQ